jgi:DNA-binding CsgD family transcriptional regulator
MWRLGARAEAQQHFENSLKLTTHRKAYELERGLARLGLGYVALWKGDSARAISQLTHAIALLDPGSATAMHVEASLWLACAKMQDDRSRQEARVLIETSLGLTQSTENESNRGLAFWLLGELELREGLYTNAEADYLQALALRYGIGHPVGAAYALQGLAVSAAFTGQSQRAAQLIGAADAIAESFGRSLVQLPGISRGEWETMVRLDLGEKHFDDCYSKGTTLRLVDAVSLALREERAPERHQHPAREILTRREAEIAQLVATGATNGRIASTLVISEETVKFHVRNILAKLDFESRTEIAAWQARKPDQEGSPTERA